MITKRVFLVPKLGNFLKQPGTSENVLELPKTPGELPENTRNFPKTPGTSQKHPELPRASRELSKTPVELQNTRGTSQKHPGRWWVVGGWVGSHNTRGRSYGSGSDCHVAHVTRVNRWLVDVECKPTWHATWQKLTCVNTWLVHVAPTATCQILLKNATSRHFWKKVASLLRTTIRTRIRICRKNIHPFYFTSICFTLLRILFCLNYLNYFKWI
jgi:hypothetical protein